MVMRRREFLGVLGGAAALPLAARAQQRERMRRIGVLTGAENAEAEARLDEFQQSLQQLGWTHGRNVQIDIRRTLGDAELSRKYAAELVELGRDVIFAAGGANMGPLHQTSCTVPIVFAIVPDPVGSGFVNSLARPGGNATGFMQFEYSLAEKWQYNLYSKIDTEAPRYLDFEKWWGGHVNLNAQEIQFIVDELFVGNNQWIVLASLSGLFGLLVGAILIPIVGFVVAPVWRVTKDYLNRSPKSA